MKYAIIETGGKQYQVSEGQTLEIELIGKDKGPVTFDKVLLYVDGGKVKIGKPHLKGITVKAKVEDLVKGEKLRVGKYKAKSRYRRVVGHRQKYAKITVDKIETKTSTKSK